MRLYRAFAKDFKAHMSTQSFSRRLKKTHYDTLKLTENSTQDEIKTAYYKLSKEYHPDLNKSEGARKQFQDISDAYEVLGNFSKRKLYDRDLMTRGDDIHIRRATYSNVNRTDETASMYEKQRDAQYPFNESRRNTYDYDE